MSRSDRSDGKRPEDARLTQMDVLDEQFVLAIFSNGQSVRIPSSKINELAAQQTSELTGFKDK